MSKRTSATSDRADGFNQIVEQWKLQFDKAPDIEMRFGVNSLDSLCLNGIVLCPLKDTKVQYLSFDVEEFTLATDTGTVFIIFIRWPFEGRPVVYRIAKHQDIFTYPDF